MTVMRCATLVLSVLFASHASAATLQFLGAPENKSPDVQDELHQLVLAFGAEEGDKETASAAPTDTENPKCDKACTNGSEKMRAQCNLECSKMQAKICPKSFSCHKACGNHIKQIKKDPQCERLCDDVRDNICFFEFEAPKDKLSPHHDEKPPPSMEATPAPKIYSGSFPICNLYPAAYEFEIVRLPNEKAKDGEKITNLGYKQCAKIQMSSLEAIGLKVDGKLSGTSRMIVKTPSVMLFGQWAYGNHQVEFNRYFAKGDGPVICNGFPFWETKEKGEKINIARNGKAVAGLRYKECMPTSMKNGDVISAQIMGKDAGEYKVVGSPSAIVMGKAGESRALAFEAWKGEGEVSL